MTRLPVLDHARRHDRKSSDSSASSAGSAGADSPGVSPLTDRESDVLRAAESGGTVADVAGALHLSEGTVRNYLSSAIGKTRARTRAEAVRFARVNGWL